MDKSEMDTSRGIDTRVCENKKKTNIEKHEHVRQKFTLLEMSKECENIEEVKSHYTSI